MKNQLANFANIAVWIVLCIVTAGVARGETDPGILPKPIELPTIELPTIDDETQPAELPPPQELPSGPTASEKPAIDASASDPQVAEPAPAIDTPRAAADPADQPPVLDEPAAQEPEAAEAAEEPVDTGAAEIEPEETIQERYPDGKVKVERGVRQDRLQNYLNHGPWRMWDQQGRLVVEGLYRDGQAEGQWTRWYAADGAEMFSQSPFNLYQAPFASRATFRTGKLKGHWIITDQNERKICDWNFVDGRRDGKSSWWYPNGNPMREINYVAGQVHGELLEWDEGGKLVTRVEYEDGRRLDQAVQKYKDGQKQYEGAVLHARLIMKQPDDWWSATLATYVQEGKDQKHGDWTAWYPNGKKKFSGQYERDLAEGQFTWWHSNGQLALEGSYRDGRKHGEWTWWHESGQRSIQGQYRNDVAADRWVWWHENGKVAQRVDFTGTGAQVVSLPEGGQDLDAEMMGRSIMLNRPQNGADPADDEAN